jgi:hypothetical protein
MLTINSTLQKHLRYNDIDKIMSIAITVVTYSEMLLFQSYQLGRLARHLNTVKRSRLGCIPPLVSSLKAVHVPNGQLLVDLESFNFDELGRSLPFSTYGNLPSEVSPEHSVSVDK